MLARKQSTKQVLLQATPFLLAANLLLPFVLLFENYPIDLSGPLALGAYLVAESGGTVYLPLIILGMLHFLLSGAFISRKHYFQTMTLIVIVLSLFLGGGAYLNEHVIKPFFAVPRPCIEQLAKDTNGKSDLGISSTEFYEIHNPDDRRQYLRVRLLGAEDQQICGPKMWKCVLNHWIHESGYSFPSGHSFSSMMVATFFLGLGLAYFTDTRRWVCFGMVFWALAVCYSRPILRVHSSYDVFAGSCEGMLIGALAFFVFRTLIDKFNYKESTK